MGALRAFVDRIEAAGLDLHSFALWRDGDSLAEIYWEPYGAEKPHVLYSLSKSFASTAVGLAVDEGRFSLDDKIVSFFSDKLPAEVSPNLSAMLVRHLLSMSCGHDTEPYDARGDDDWVSGFLRHPVVHEPGTHFVYNSLATYMCSAIVQKTTGETLLDYLTPRLFGPLGMTEAAWESCPLGINCGGWGLSLTTPSILKFGILYLEDGVWDGARILPVGWVTEATKSHVSNGDNPDSDWAQGYGFQFWRCRHNGYRGDGAFGQYCIVLPDHRAVIAITSSVDDMQAVLNAVWEELLPNIDQIQPEDLGRRTIAAPGGSEGPSLCRTFESSKGLSRVRIETKGPSSSLRIWDDSDEKELRFDSGSWQPGSPVWGMLQPFARGGWQSPSRFTLKVCDAVSPRRMVIEGRLDEHSLSLTVQDKGTFRPMPEQLFEGREALETTTSS
jgi:CubicO group peptidase (beta-lactamase class C family)